MFASVVRMGLLAPAAALLSFAVMANRDWFERHVLLPALYQPPPSWTLDALRTGAVALGLALGGCAIVAGRRATPGGVARVALALVLACGASEYALRVTRRVVPLFATGLEAPLGAPDPRTGWSFRPRRTLELPLRGGGRVIRYSIDARGDRAPSEDWLEDTQAPTLLVTGESIAAGHGLQWGETFAARLGQLAHAQVVDVAVVGYASDQAHLRAIEALARLARPVAVLSTVLPVQLHRNLRDDRPHLVLRDGALALAPAAAPGLRLRRILVDDLPYLSEAGLQRSLELTHAILGATAAAARARGAQPLFIVPSFGPPRPFEAHPEAFIVRAVLGDLPHLVVDIDPSHRLPSDGHPDAEGARQIATAIAAVLELTR